MPNKKKLLVAGGGYADVPIIRAAKKLGYYVVTSGNRPNELGHRESDEYRNADFSDLDAMLSLSQELQIDAICPCCNDFSLISASYVANKLELPGYDSYETTLILHHKDRYRQFAIDNNIPTPFAKGFSDVDTATKWVERFDMPIIIKPVDLTGGKGIKKISNKIDAVSSINEAFSISKSKRIVVEEFIEGSRHGFSALIKDKKIIFYFVDNEHYFLNQYMVSGASTPSIVPDKIIDDLIFQSENIASLLELKDGIFHVQFIMDGKSAKIIEICRRPPGDLYIEFVSYATGIDYSREIIKPYINSTYEGTISSEVNGNYLRHCIMTDKKGTLKNIIYRNELKDKIIGEELFWAPGMRVEDIMTTKFGILFLKFQSKEEMLKYSENVHKYIDIEYES